MEYERKEQEALKAKFTAWINTTVKNAKIDYLRKTRCQVEHVPITEIPEDILVLSENEEQWILNVEPQSPYDFEEKKLTEAFIDLPLKRRQIMELIYFEGLSEKEAASRLNCSVQHIKNQKHIAIKKLRETLLEE